MGRVGGLHVLSCLVLSDLDVLGLHVLSCLVLSDLDVLTNLLPQKKLRIPSANALASQTESDFGHVSLE